jgi:hypothetical protein
MNMGYYQYLSSFLVSPIFIQNVVDWLVFLKKKPSSHVVVRHSFEQSRNDVTESDSRGFRT